MPYVFQYYQSKIPSTLTLTNANTHSLSLVLSLPLSLSLSVSVSHAHSHTFSHHTHTHTHPHIHTLTHTCTPNHADPLDPGSLLQVLDGVSFSVPDGRTVALVGASGCGKSTLLHLLLRLYDPGEGSVTLDGVELRNLNVRWLRQRIGDAHALHAHFTHTHTRTP